MAILISWLEKPEAGWPHLSVTYDMHATKLTLRNIQVVHSFIQDLSSTSYLQALRDRKMTKTIIALNDF